MTTIVLPILAFVAVFGAIFAVSLAVDWRTAAARRRISQHSMRVGTAQVEKFERIDVLKGPDLSPVALVNALLRRFPPARTGHDELMRANVNLTVAQYLSIRVVVAAALAVAVAQLTGVPLFGIVVVPVGLMAPRLLLIYQGKRRRKAFEAQLAEAIDQIVGALRAGYGFLQAMESVTKELEDPMREEFVRVIEQVNAGTPIADAIQQMPVRIDSYDLSIFVTAVVIQRNVGGNLAEVLENIAHTVRERRRIRAEVRAITTGPRASGYILGFFPLGLMLYFTLTDDGYRHIMLGETIGKIMLTGAAIWTLIGFVLSSAVSRVEY